jgi:ketosteroid isomerase-like protein
VEHVLAQIDPDVEWIETGDDVVVTGRVRARTRSGRHLDAPYAHVFSFRDGRVSRNDNFHDTAMWANALG